MVMMPEQPLTLARHHLTPAVPDVPSELEGGTCMGYCMLEFKGWARGKTSCCVLDCTNDMQCKCRRPHSCCRELDQRLHVDLFCALCCKYICCGHAALVPVQLRS